MINDPDIAVVSGNKESYIFIIKRSECFKKLRDIIDEGIQHGVCIIAEDRTLEDVKLFRSFLYRNPKKYEY